MLSFDDLRESLGLEGDGLVKRDSSTPSVDEHGVQRMRGVSEGYDNSNGAVYVKVRCPRCNEDGYGDLHKVTPYKRSEIARHPNGTPVFMDCYECSGEGSIGGVECKPCKGRGWKFKFVTMWHGVACSPCCKQMAKRQGSSKHVAPKEGTVYGTTVSHELAMPDDDITLMAQVSGILPPAKVKRDGYYDWRGAMASR